MFQSMKFSLKDAIIIFCLTWLLGVGAWYSFFPNQIRGRGGYEPFWLNSLELNPFGEFNLFLFLQPLFFSLTLVASLYLTHKKLLEDRYSLHQTFRVSLLVAFLLFTLSFIIYFFALLLFYSPTVGNPLMGFAFLAAIEVRTAPLISGCGFLLPSIIYALAYRKSQGRIDLIKVIEVSWLGATLLLMVLSTANALTCRFNQDAECLSSKADKFDDPTICNQAKENIASSCLSRFYYGKAIFGNDPSCKGLKGSYYNACLSRFAERTKEATFCDRIKPESNQDKLVANFCYKNLAVELKDPALCEKIVAIDDDTSSLLNSCYNELAGLTRNGDLCKKMELYDSYEVRRYNQCLTRLASLTKDRRLCEDLRPTTPGSWDKDDRANSSGSSKEACLRAIPSQ